eukprot:GHVP01041880.1.p1 GENE.GHVP01041880.1~~GHVP01041880.1.p1  ORF type:complete len:678 (+),score=111.76 GHVP01041880.1:1486-3519(+)
MIPNSVKLIAMAYKWQQESLECLNTILKNDILPADQKETEQLLRETVKSSTESFSLLTKLHLLTKQFENSLDDFAEKARDDENTLNLEKPTSAHEKKYDKEDLKENNYRASDSSKLIEKPKLQKKASLELSRKVRPVKVVQKVNTSNWASKSPLPVPGNLNTEPSLKIHQFQQDLNLTQPKSQNLTHLSQSAINQPSKISTSQSSVKKRTPSLSTASQPKNGNRVLPKIVPNSQRIKTQSESGRMTPSPLATNPASITPPPKPKTNRPQSQILSLSGSKKKSSLSHLIPATTVLNQENLGFFDFKMSKTVEEYNDDEIRTVVAHLTDQSTEDGRCYSIVATSPKSYTAEINLETQNPPQSICASVSIQGNKTSANGSVMPNQDKSFIYEVSNAFAVYGVFDGHGEKGHQIADIVCQRFLKTFKAIFPAQQRKEDGSFIESVEGNNPLVSEKYLLTWLRSVFRQIDAEVINEYQDDIVYSGCTASVAVRCDNAVYVGYVGDSKVVGIEFIESKATRVMETPEHSPCNETELARIQKTGAHVSTSYYDYLRKNVSRIVEAGISVSRAFGDLEARKYGLICRPEFVKFERRSKPKETPQASKALNSKPKTNYYYPLLVVLATDGLWDTLETQELLQYCKNDHREKSVLEEQIKLITRIAWSRRLRAEGRSDDTTATVILV